MDQSSSANIRIENLSERNFHSWKHKIELVLGHREVDEMIDINLCPRRLEDAEELTKWLRKDKLAHMTIGLTLSDEMLKNVQHTSTALEMWTEICNVHQRHTLLNKLAARRDFYTATMRSDERILSYINRVRQMASVLESMGVEIEDKELAMAVLNGLPDRYQPIITALDAIDDEDDSFTLDKVRSRLLQEEKRSSIRSDDPANNIGKALFNKGKSRLRRNSHKKGNYCGLSGHCEPDFWEKHGKPTGYRVGKPSQTSRDSNRNDTAAVASSLDNPECGGEPYYVCLMTQHALSALETSSANKASVWHVDSCASSHMTFDRSVLVNYTSTKPFSVEMGNSTVSKVRGYGDIILNIVVNGSQNVCKLEGVLHIPAFTYSLISVGTLAKRGVRCSFDEKGFNLVRNGHVVARGSLKNILYVLDTTISALGRERSFVSSLQLWHERMGHVHNAGIQNMARKKTVKGLTITSISNEKHLCEGCITGKMPRAPILKASTSRANEILNLVHTDVSEFSTPSRGGAKYFVTFIDDKSLYVTVHPMRNKSQ